MNRQIVSCDCTLRLARAGCPCGMAAHVGRVGVEPVRQLAPRPPARGRVAECLNSLAGRRMAWEIDDIRRDELGFERIERAGHAQLRVRVAAEQAKVRGLPQRGRRQRGQQHVN